MEGDPSQENETVKPAMSEGGSPDQPHNDVTAQSSVPPPSPPTVPDADADADIDYDSQCEQRGKHSNCLPGKPREQAEEFQEQSEKQNNSREFKVKQQEGQVRPAKQLDHQDAHHMEEHQEEQERKEEKEEEEREQVEKEQEVQVRPAKQLDHQDARHMEEHQEEQERKEEEEQQEEREQVEKEQEVQVRPVKQLDHQDAHHMEEHQEEQERKEEEEEEEREEKEQEEECDGVPSAITDGCVLSDVPSQSECSSRKPETAKLTTAITGEDRADGQSKSTDGSSRVDGQGVHFDLVEDNADCVEARGSGSSPTMIEATTDCGVPGGSLAMVETNNDCVESLGSPAMIESATDLGGPAGSPTMVDVRLEEGSAASTPDCQSLDGASCDGSSSHCDSSCHAQLQQLQSRLQTLTLSLSDRCHQLATSEQQLLLSRQAESSCRKQLQQLRAQAEASARDRDRAVLRFAEREKDLTKLQRDLASSDRRQRELARERDLLTSKLTSMGQDTAKLRRAFDLKHQEIRQMVKENDMRKEQISSRDVKIQWLQNKLSQETSILKETQLRMDEMRNQLVSSQSALYDLQQQQQQRNQRQQEDETDEAETSGTTADEQDSVNVHGDSSCEQCQAELDSLRQSVTSLQSQLDDVIPRAESAELLSEELENERRVSAQLRGQIDESHDEVSDCRGQLAVMSEKHAEMLQYTMKMTDKNVELQVTASSLTAQRDTALSECDSLTSQLSASQLRVNQLTEQLHSHEQRSTAEQELLRQRLQQLEEKCQQVARLYDDEKNNVAILTKRHQMLLKERAGTMARLRQSRDTPAQNLHSVNPSSSIPSSTHPSSSSSPSTLENGHTAPSNGTCGEDAEDVETLARLRRQRGRLKLRVSELVQQNDQLVEEVRRKSQLLNSYLLREQTGALSSRGMDRSKADMMRMGGIMASVYGSEQRDETMTLELSLEITRKLQAVLEDTLLKNITLKDNLNILGQEIDRLNAENKSLKSTIDQ